MEKNCGFFLNKKIRVNQYKKGYRFSVDAPFLADFLPRDHSSVLEVGTGSGIISLIALYKEKFRNITLIEIQEELFSLAYENLDINGFSSRTKLIRGDFLKYDFNWKFDLIFSNPPYLSPESGRVSPDIQKSTAKFEIRLGVDSFLERSSELLAEKGKICLIVPYSRYSDVQNSAERYGLFTEIIRKIYSFENGKPERILLQLTNYKVTLKESAPLIVFKDKGEYSDEANKIFSGD